MSNFDDYDYSQDDAPQSPLSPRARREAVQRKMQGGGVPNRADEPRRLAGSAFKAHLDESTGLNWKVRAADYTTSDEGRYVDIDGDRDIESDTFMASANLETGHIVEIANSPRFKEPFRTTVWSQNFNENGEPWGRSTVMGGNSLPSGPNDPTQAGDYVKGVMRSDHFVDAIHKVGPPKTIERGMPDA